jgi:general secretion pathway protein A
MDLLSYFQLNEKPFKISPDPRFLYFSEQVKEAVARCEYMAKERIGPIYMYGAIGAGKTTILRRLYELFSQDDRYNVLPIISPNLKSSNSFLRLILDEWEIKTARSYTASLRNFETFLMGQDKEDKVPLLLIDEAQNMNRDTLRLLHYLMNFETEQYKLLQIILVGQDELANKILRFSELASRMFPIAINAMSQTGLKEMIEFRWSVAGSKQESLIADDEGYRTLYAYTKGLPRDAVKVCDEVMRVLASSGRKQASTEDITAVCEQFRLKI